MEHSNIQFIRIYWQTRNCQNAQYRAANRRMLKYFVAKERARREAFNRTTAGL